MNDKGGFELALVHPRREVEWSSNISADVFDEIRPIVVDEQSFS